MIFLVISTNGEPLVRKMYVIEDFGVHFESKLTFNVHIRNTKIKDQQYLDIS